MMMHDELMMPYKTLNRYKWTVLPA